MNSVLEAKYLRLEQSRNRLLDELEGFDNELLNTSPAEGKWSLNQIVAHLVLVEQQIVKVVEHQINGQKELPSSTFFNEIRSVLLKLALKSGKKYKAPASVASVPQTAALADLRVAWDEVRFKLEDVLTDLPHSLLNKCLFQHPYAGPLTIQQTLTFLQDHFDHHLSQLHQLERSFLK
ncbi:DinB family protein [Pontibacter chitinilyticus]|uniref:DinB family protein n=1 Tax=Pontibacter chitinilyticus TaxID=2674989 RepID=UPI00321C009A